MTYIAGVVNEDRVYLSGDRRSSVGSIPTGDNFEKVKEICYSSDCFVYGASGQARLVRMLDSAMSIDKSQVDRGDLPAPQGVEDLADRVVEAISESPTGPYRGHILIGGFDQAGKGLIFIAHFDGEQKVTEKRISCGEVHLTPSNVDILTRVKNKVAQEVENDVEGYLRGLSVWVARNDESDSCGEEVDVVVAEKTDA